MLRGWMRRFGATLVFAGLLAVAMSTWWPAEGEDVALAAGASDDAASPAEGEDGEQQAWRDAVRVAGGIILAAGLGLLLLALLPTGHRGGD